MNILFLEGDMSRRGGTERMTSILSNLLVNTHRVHVMSLHFQGEEIAATIRSSDGLPLIAV